MIRSVIFCIIALASFSSAYSRNIRGTVISDKDSTAVAGASCRLFAGDQLIVGVSADANGNFSLDFSNENTMRLEISMTGFNPSEIVLMGNSKNTDLGHVYLNEGVSLDELTVTAGEQIDSRGRTIVFPSAAEVRASATSLSLFGKLPLAGLETNPINRTLSVDRGTPMILINGVPSTVDDLNSLQPKDIAKIEYSRVTPARYADKGYSGLLNITLKQRNDGGQVYAWGRSAVTTAFVDANIRASYHQGPSQFSLTYNPSWRNYQKVYDNTVESYIGDDFRVDLEEHDRNPFNYHYHNIQFKYDYSPNAATLLSATFKAIPLKNSSRSIATTSDSELGQYDNYNKSSSSDFAPSLDIFFRRDFNDKNSLEVQVTGTLSSSDYRRSNLYDFGNGTTTDYVMDADSRRRSLISEICYSHEFSNKTSLSAGYQNTVSHSTNTYLSSDYKPVLTENNNYVYARLGQQIGRVYLSVASGLKLFWIENDLNKRHFIKNLSSAQVSWSITNKWHIAAAFSYTPGIPSLTALTDYPQQSTPYLISNGNPDLKVSETLLYQLMPSFQYRKFSTSLLVNYRNINNSVISDVRYIGDKIFISQSINAHRSTLADGNLNLRLSDIYGFGANVNIGFAHYYTQGDGWSHHLNSFDASFSVWWNKGPYTISYWRKIPGKYLNGHYVGKDENGDALSFEYKAGKHWTFGVDWMYMFDVNGTKYPAWDYSSVNPSYRERYIKNNGNMVVLSASYSADFGSIFRSAKRSLNNSDNGSSLLKM